RDAKQQPNQIFAANTSTNPNGSGGNANFMGTSTGKTVRLTVPPVQPFDPQPIARGAMPTPQQANPRTGPPQWQAGVVLDPPVPISPAIPRIPSSVPDTGVQLGVPGR